LQGLIFVKMCSSRALSEILQNLGKVANTQILWFFEVFTGLPSLRLWERLLLLLLEDGCLLHAHRAMLLLMGGMSLPGVQMGLERACCCLQAQWSAPEAPKAEPYPFFRAINIMCVYDGRGQHTSVLQRTLLADCERTILIVMPSPLWTHIIWTLPLKTMGVLCGAQNRPVEKSYLFLTYCEGPPFFEDFSAAQPFLLQQVNNQLVHDFLSQQNNRLFLFLSELMDLFVAGQYQSAADQPNNLAEGHPPL